MYDSQQTPNPAPPGGSNGKATASLVLGIVSIVIYFFSVIPFLSLLGLVAAIIGIIMSSKAKKIGPSGAGTAGLVLSIISLCLNALSFIVCTVCVLAFASAAPDLLSELSGLY